MIEKFDFTIKRDTWDTRPPRVLSSRLSRMATRAATETSCKARCSFKSLLTVKIKCNNNLGKDYNNFLWMLDLKSGCGLWRPGQCGAWSGAASCHCVTITKLMIAGLSPVVTCHVSRIPATCPVTAATAGSWHVSRTRPPPPHPPPSPWRRLK